MPAQPTVHDRFETGTSDIIEAPANLYPNDSFRPLTLDFDETVDVLCFELDGELVTDSSVYRRVLSDDEQWRFFNRCLPSFLVAYRGFSLPKSTFGIAAKAQDVREKVQSHMSDICEGHGVNRLQMPFKLKIQDFTDKHGRPQFGIELWWDDYLIVEVERK